MITVNIHEAKTHFSHYISLIEKGEKVIICRHNVPVAELSPILRSESKPKRFMGKSKYKIEVPDSFFDPLPDDLLDLFEGNNPDDPLNKK